MKKAMLLFWLLVSWRGRGAEYQFSSPVMSPDGKERARAWLWIPPQCHQVRGLIIGEQTILEKLVFEDPIIRKTAARENLGIVIVFPNPWGEFDYHAGAGGVLEKILNDLATESGYPEIAEAPL